MDREISVSPQKPLLALRVIDEQEVVGVKSGHAQVHDGEVECIRHGFRRVLLPERRGMQEAESSFCREPGETLVPPRVLVHREVAPPVDDRR